MENKRGKGKVFDDDVFGTCINLQTGATLNLDRKLAVRSEPNRPMMKFSSSCYHKNLEAFKGPSM